MHTQQRMLLFVFYTNFIKFNNLFSFTLYLIIEKVPIALQ